MTATDDSTPTPAGPPSAESPSAGPPVTCPVTVRWRDLDPFGHVNHAVFLSYLELVRTEYFAGRLHINLKPPPFLVARVEIDYLRAVYLGDAVHLTARTVEVGRKSLTMEYDVVAENLPAARARVVLVWMGADGRSVAVPDSVRTVLAEFEGRPEWCPTPALPTAEPPPP